MPGHGSPATAQRALPPLLGPRCPQGPPLACHGSEFPCTQAQLLHVCVEHVRLEEELMQALGSVLALVALHDGHDSALLSGLHGVPESWQERVDVAGVRLTALNLNRLTRWRAPCSLL